jgi:hypothetical protein
VLAAWRWVLRFVAQGLIFLCYVLATICLAILTCIGYALTWLYKRAGWPDGLTAWNCWAFVIAKWLEAGPSKTYLIVRKSLHTAVPHIFFAESIEGLQVSELKPLRPKHGWNGLWRVFYHKSRVREGEGEEKKK